MVTNVLQNLNLQDINDKVDAENQPIGVVVRVFTNGLGDWGSIPGQAILKTQKMVLDTSLLNTQHYKVWIKGK